MEKSSKLIIKREALERRRKGIYVDSKKGGI